MRVENSGLFRFLIAFLGVIKGKGRDKGVSVNMNFNLISFFIPLFSILTLFSTSHCSLLARVYGLGILIKNAVVVFCLYFFIIYMHPSSCR